MCTEIWDCIITENWNCNIEFKLIKLFFKNSFDDYEVPTDHSDYFTRWNSMVQTSLHLAYLKQK